MRYVADAIEIRRVSARDLAVPTGAVADGPVFADFAAAARRGIAAADAAGLKRSVGALLAMTARGSFQASALRWCRAELDRYGVGRPAELAALVDAVAQGRLGEVGPDALAPSPARHDGPDLRAVALAIARQQIVVLQTPCDPSIASGRIDAVGVVLLNLAAALAETAAAEPLAAALAAVRTTGDLAPLTRLVEGWDGGATRRAPARVAAAPDEPDPAPEASAPVPAGADRVVNRLLRIDQAKIDTIMNLVAELIVAKNGLSYLATRTEEVHGCRAAAREIKDQFAVIDRITQGLQVGVMSVRMMPVGQVFQRFPRLVRDIARKLGKKIDLVIEGEDTEADKNVLESLADPLIHMVRNSLDHGVESPADRLAAGKPEQGTVRISARQESDFVVIDVRDDGRGIDPQRVKEKAVQSGLVTREAAQAMSDEAAANLVFAPGFSTRDAVSDLSGRGVGMDVVRSAVIKAGGDVMLRSVLGTGTTVTVRLPLTMAVTRIVTIMCQGRVFGIPMDLVVETVRIARDRIHRIKGAETFVLRDTIVPMVRLARCLGLQEAEDREPDAEEAIMVVRLGRDRVGMVVDGFRERMEVIVKPLDGILEGLPGFSGTALLGDGRVLLILDLQEVL
jgi:two-component system chemotaxis sensor kinase CheA